MSKLQTYTDANWEAEVMASSEPVLVDFWADWCQPCKVLMPTIEAVAEQYKGRLRVALRPACTRWAARSCT